MNSAFLFSLLAMSSTALALGAASLRPGFSGRHASVLGSVAAGMLIVVCFLHLLPEALEAENGSSALLLVGFAGGALLTYALQKLWSGGADHAGYEVISVLTAIGIHSLIDGMIYSVTFATEYWAGVYAASGLILHEFPEAIVTYAILRRSGSGNLRSCLIAFLVAGITTPLGVILADPVVASSGSDSLSNLFALSVGLLIYIATGPLMAPLREAGSGRHVMAFMTGLLAAVLLSSVSLI